nr:hypothetical protein CFP56_33005 [Quercus suber]
MENESSKEGSNEAYQNCRSPDDSGNVKHANNADSGHWRVGDGCKIKIFGDPWLLDNNVRQIIAPNNSLPENSTVDVLIDQQTREWKHNLIDSSFTPDEAKLIKAILLSSLPQNDFLFWPLDSYGDYIVKSGYKMLSEECSYEEDSYAARGISKLVWKGI